MSEQYIALMRGLPGSGKTTEALIWMANGLEPRGRTNRDELRMSMFGRKVGLTFQQEQMITEVQRAAVKSMLSRGMSVVIDDTNLKLKNARGWADVAVEEDVDFHVCDMDTPVEVCIFNDANRDEPVGASVIRHLNARFANRDEVLPHERKTQVAPLPYVPNRTCAMAWMVDIDGTLADKGDRSPYDETKVLEDGVHVDVVQLVDALVHEGYRIVLMSGRSRNCAEDTIKWLRKHQIPYDELHMRAAGDNRADYIVKAELFDNNVRDRWNVRGVLDDRTQVVDMWRSMGLTCLQVAKGDF